MRSLLDLTTIIFPIVHLVVIALLSIVAFRRNKGVWRLVTPLVLSTWFAVALWFSFQPAVRDLSSFPPPMAIVITIPLVVGIGLMFGSKAWRSFLLSFPQDWLIGVQVYRVLGYTFLVGWLLQIIPDGLGPITGVADVLIGMSAIPVALYATRSAFRGRGWVVAVVWNIVGLLDFAWSVSITLLAAPTVVQILQLTPGVEAIGTQPFALIALWAVPFSILLHSASLYRLMSDHRA